MGQVIRRIRNAVNRRIRNAVNRRIRNAVNIGIRKQKRQPALKPFVRIVGKLSKQQLLFLHLPAQPQIYERGLPKQIKFITLTGAFDPKNPERITTKKTIVGDVSSIPATIEYKRLLKRLHYLMAERLAERTNLNNTASDIKKRLAQAMTKIKEQEKELDLLMPTIIREVEVMEIPVDPRSKPRKQEILVRKRKIIRSRIKRAENLSKEARRKTEKEIESLKGELKKISQRLEQIFRVESNTVLAKVGGTTVAFPVSEKNLLIIEQKLSLQTVLDSKEAAVRKALYNVIHRPGRKPEISRIIGNAMQIAFDAGYKADYKYIRRILSRMRDEKIFD